MFIIADYSQVEARICPYLAGDTKTVDMVRAGMSVYEVHARLTMGYNDPGKLKIVDPAKYDLAKARRLALQFGCGWQRFRDQAQMEHGIGLDWPNEKFKLEVADFRSKETKTVDLWKQLDNDFKLSLGETYELELPSGRIIPFFDVQLGSQTRKGAPRKGSKADFEGVTEVEYTSLSYKASMRRGEKPKWIYGGLLCNNLVQGCARDVFGDGLLRVEDELPDVTYIWPTHDEGVWIVPEDVAEERGQQVEELLSITPDYLGNCPIAAEVTVSKVYKK